MGVAHVQEPIRRPHGYPQHQWIQVRSGTLTLETPDRTGVVRTGDGFYLRPDEPHAYRSEARSAAVVDWVGFDGTGVPPALAGTPLRRSGVYRLSGTQRIDAALARAWAAVCDPTAPAPRLSACVYELLMALAEEVAGPGQASLAAGQGRLAPVLEALALRPAEAWDVASLAAVIGVSPQHLGRLFRRAYGLAPLEYVVRFRIHRALQLLAGRPDLKVHEVAASVGYADANYFVRLFRQREGITPGQFRDLHRG
jgi:AraC-like DNA-binding protein